MSEQPISEKEALLESYRKSGKITALTGIKPAEPIRKLINDDPEKLKAFLDGAQQGQDLLDSENPPEKK